MAIAGLISFESANLITQFPLKKLMSSPPGCRYVSTTLEQIRKADLHIWRCLGKLCRRGIRRQSTGVSPLDDNVRDVLKDFDLALIVQCLPRPMGGGKSSSSEGTPSNVGKYQAPRNRRKKEAYLKRKRELDEAEARLKSERDAFAKQARVEPPLGKAAGKRGVRLPQALFGKEARTATGQACRFAYNLGNCQSKVAPGARCDKGLYVCMEPVNVHACGLPHTVGEHRNAVR